jgi:hypothetical protein
MESIQQPCSWIDRKFNVLTSFAAYPSLFSLISLKACQENLVMNAINLFKTLALIIAVSSISSSVLASDDSPLWSDLPANEKRLSIAATIMNKYLPAPFGGDLWLERVSAENPTQFTRHLRFRDTEANKISSDTLNALRTDSIQSICKDTFFVDYLDHGNSLRYNAVDKAGVSVLDYTLDSQTCLSSTR